MFKLEEDMSFFFKSFFFEIFLNYNIVLMLFLFGRDFIYGVKMKMVD